MPKMVRCFLLDADVIESYKFSNAQLDGLKFSQSLHVSICRKVKQSLYRPSAFQAVEAPKIQDNRHMNVVRLSALRTGRLYPPQGYSAAGMIMSMKNSNGTIGNRAHDLPTCSAVPQPTALPRAPQHVKNVLKIMWVQGGLLHPELPDRLYESRPLFFKKKGTCRSIHTDRYKIHTHV